MKIAILGFGTEGRSALDYWKSSNNQITICDQSEIIKVPSGISSQLGLNYLSNLNEFDLIIRSPGIHPNDIIKANNPEIISKITTATNEFLRISPSKNIIGVTGTKGKGTTSTLISKLLQASGYNTYLGGNIGNSAIDLLKNNIQPQDWIVLELSSFQLIDLKYSPKIGVCLMIAPEHLNWHLNYEEYISSKGNIFSHQSNSDTAIYFVENIYSTQLAGKSLGEKIPYYSPPGAYLNDNNIIINDNIICRTTDIQLIGKHNLQNVCAALTAYWQVSQDVNCAREVIITFKGLEHRLELVREQDNINYYNDSFASMPEATIAALEAINGPKLMIIGGFDRGLDLSNLTNSLKKHESEIEKVILIGASANRITKELQKVNFANYQVSEAKTMTEIVRLVKDSVKPKCSIVLSPGFPSFDMFRNFEDRGKQFKEAVHKL